MKSKPYFFLVKLFFKKYDMSLFAFSIIHLLHVCEIYFMTCVLYLESRNDMFGSIGGKTAMNILVLL